MTFEMNHEKNGWTRIEMGEVWHFDAGLSFIFLIHADNNCQPEAKYLIYQGTKPISQRIISHPGYPLLSGCQAGAKTLHLNSTRVTDSDSQKALLEYQAQQSLETMDDCKRYLRLSSTILIKCS